MGDGRQGLQTLHSPRAGRRGPGKQVVAALSFVLPVGTIAALFVLLIAARNRAEPVVADLATLLPFGWAFAAGMVSSVNPCGFFMLPAYLSYQLGTEEAGFYTTSPLRRGVKALALGLVATAGFIVVAGIVGTIVAAGGRQLVQVFPYAGVAVGVLLAALGFWLLLTGRTFGIAAAHRAVVTPRRNLRNVFLFGMAYAVGSLSCTLPIFLLVVGTSLASRGLTDAFAQFISYALGMGSILVAVTIGAALFRGSVARFLRLVTPYVHRMSALLLVGAGFYLIAYWLWLSGSAF